MFCFVLFQCDLALRRSPSLTSLAWGWGLGGSRGSRTSSLCGGSERWWRWSVGLVKPPWIFLAALRAVDFFHIPIGSEWDWCQPIRTADLTPTTNKRSGLAELIRLLHPSPNASCEFAPAATVSSGFSATLFRPSAPRGLPLASPSVALCRLMSS